MIHFLQTIPIPLVAPPMLSSVPYFIVIVSFWSKTPAGENKQEWQYVVLVDLLFVVFSLPMFLYYLVPIWCCLYILMSELTPSSV